MPTTKRNRIKKFKDFIVVVYRDTITEFKKKL